MLQIDKDWRIREDSMCWILEQRSTNAETFEESWKNRGYYTLLEDALSGACNQMLKTSKDMADLVRQIDELHTTIQFACANIKLEPNKDMDFLD